jgi:hypothetical protein
MKQKALFLVVDRLLNTRHSLPKNRPAGRPWLKELKLNRVDAAQNNSVIPVVLSRIDDH